MIIYKATNKINGKIYIGQTIVSLALRKRKHWNHANCQKNNYHFCNALRKYGVNGFKWQVICICPNVKSLNEQEEYYIVYYNSMEDGYNCTSGGKSNSGYRASEETKEKLSEMRKGKNHWNYGKHHSTKTKEKMRISRLKYHKNNGMSKETREKLRQFNLGKKLSEEHKKKIGKANSGKKRTKKTLEKMREKRNDQTL